MSVRTRFLEGFDDPTFGPDQWAALLCQGETNSIDLTWHMQRAWWDTCGRGDLLLILAERDGVPIALAPLFTDDGWIYNICLKDYLDFVGDISDPDVLDALLIAARDRVADFVCLRFYFVPAISRTGQRLQEAAVRLGFNCRDEGALPLPVMDVAAQPEFARARANRERLRRPERRFLREGPLEVHHMQDGDEIFPHLDDFFAQHIARRAATPQPSPFVAQSERGFYRRMTELAGRTGWLRFTRIDWANRPIAFHFGFSYRGRYLWGVPSFAIDLERRAPGNVLLRHSLLAAIDEGATIFDFGVGDEPYKQEYATHVDHMCTWGLYAD